MTNPMSRSGELWDPARQARSEDDIADLQQRALAREWARIWDDPIPYYRSKFEAAGLTRDVVPALDDIPRTFKQDLRDDESRNPPWGEWRSVPFEAATVIQASSGTSGLPMIYTRTYKDAELQSEATARNWWRTGLRPFGRMCHSWPSGIYTGAGGQVGALRQFPAMEVPLGPPFTVEMAVEHLKMFGLFKPTAFMMTGSQLQIYEQAAAQIGVDLRTYFEGTSVQFIEASCQYDEPRKRFEDRYGFRLFNISGASEIPTGTFSDCRFHTGFHTHADLVILQIVDPATGRSVEPGGRGHVVWTYFGGDALWLRYDVEDWGELSQGPCPCGETGPRYRLLGRDSDMMEMGGRRLFPLDVQLALEAFGAPEFMIRKTGEPGLSLQVEGDADDGVAAALSGQFGAPVTIEWVAIGSLPRPSFKPKRT